MSHRTLGFGSLLFVVALPLAAPAVLRAADAKALTFEVYQDRSMEYRWRLKQGDDILREEVIFSTLRPRSGSSPRDDFPTLGGRHAERACYVVGILRMP